MNIPTITHKASEKPNCPYCGTGKLHHHIVVVDTGICDYIKSLGDFKDDDASQADNSRSKKDCPMSYSSYSGCLYYKKGKCRSKVL